MLNYLCKKFFSYDLKLSRNIFVTDEQPDRQTDGRQLVLIARPLVKYGQLKIGVNIFHIGSRQCRRCANFQLQNLQKMPLFRTNTAYAMEI